MKYRPSKLLAMIILLSSIPSVASLARAQTPAQERADSLRLQLEELKTRQLELETHLQSLEEQLQPENIEKSLAGVGSTRPEDLRELRRKQLDKEKQSIQQQLTLITKSQTRLESAITQADADAYHQSAIRSNINDVVDDATAPMVTVNKTVRPRRIKKRAKS